MTQSDVSAAKRFHEDVSSAKRWIYCIDTMLQYVSKNRRLYVSNLLSHDRTGLMYLIFLSSFFTVTLTFPLMHVHSASLLDCPTPFLRRSRARRLSYDMGHLCICYLRDQGFALADFVSSFAFAARRWQLETRRFGCGLAPAPSCSPVDDCLSQFTCDRLSLVIFNKSGNDTR